MKFVAATMILLVSATATLAATVDTGVPNLVQAPGTNGACATFQVGNLSTFFVVQTTDSKYEDEFTSLSKAQFGGLSVTFVDAGTTVANCQGYELAQDVALGTAPTCLLLGTVGQLDFTNSCDAILAAEIGSF